MATKKLTAIVIDALEDIKARDIKLINVSKLTSVFDYIAIASADSTRQTKALAKNVIDKVKEAGGWIYGTEGEQSGEWVLVDCGDVVVHIMQPAVREHYKLEELWGEGKLEYPKPAAPRTRKVAAPVPEEAKPSTRKKPTAKKPAAKKPVAKKPASGKPAVKKPIAKKPAVKKPVAKKPTARKPAAKAPVAKKPAAVKKPAAMVKRATTNAAIKSKKAATAKSPAARRRKTAST